MNNAVEPEQKVNEVRELNGVNLNPLGLKGDGSLSPVDKRFVYHAPSEKQRPCYAAINEAARVLAHTIELNTPPGDDQDAAIRKVVEAKMTANTAIATNPQLYQ